MPISELLEFPLPPLTMLWLNQAGCLLSTSSTLLVRGREEINKLFFKIEVCSKYFVQDCSSLVIKKYFIFEYFSFVVDFTLDQTGVRFWVAQL